MTIELYTIKKGDNLSTISKATGLPVNYLQTTNGIDNPNKIKEGQILRIIRNDSDFFVKESLQQAAKTAAKPAVSAQTVQTTVYTIKNGENLSIIAKNNGITLEELLNVNPHLKKNPNSVKIGQKINLPVSSKTTASSNPKNNQTKYTTEQIKNKIKEKVKEFGLDESLVLGLVEQESNFDPVATSKTGAAGLFQLTKIAAKQVKGEKTYDVDKNIEYGLKYLKWCIDNTQTEEEALVAYNRGLKAMKTAKAEGKAIDSITDKKNGKGYAENVLELRKKYQ